MTNIDTNQIPEHERNIWLALETAGFPTYLVGGAVRDILSNNTPHDFDLATQANPGQINDVISKKFPKSKIDFVGASFGVVLVDGIEVATFRGDRYDKDEFEVEYVDTIEEDLSRRDFTINAIAVDVHGDVVDPFGGYSDISNKIIKFVGDPNLRIQEDAVRILRGCRFYASTKFEIDPASAVAMFKANNLVKGIAPERIRLELLKALECDEPSRFFLLLDSVGALQHIIPELREGINQDGGKWHAESVFDHNMLVGDALSSKRPLLRLAGYLHDISKPAVFNPEDGSFIHHENKGYDVVRNRLFALKFSKKEVDTVSGLVKNHMRVLVGLSPKAQRKLIARLAEFGTDWRDLVRLRIADKKGNLRSSQFSISRIKGMIDSCTREEEVPLSVNDLAVKGGELIKHFDLTPGPIVSDLQNHLLNFSIETGISNRDELLKEAEAFLSVHYAFN